MLNIEQQTAQLFDQYKDFVACLIQEIRSRDASIKQLLQENHDLKYRNMDLPG